MLKQRKSTIFFICLMGNFTFSSEASEQLIPQIRSNLNSKKIYTKKKQLKLTLQYAAEQDVIRYTLDGSQPKKTSLIYRAPVKLKKTTVVKACVYRGKKRCSKVYRWKIHIKRPWKITQYADRSGSQAMFYTLCSPTGGLIVVDGGTVGNAAYVRKIIKEKGGVVDAWFLTHPHADHIGAFNQIYPDPQGITIKKIYDTPIDYQYYDTLDQSWDEIGVYANYLNLIKGDHRVHHLNKGDQITVGSLTIKVLNSYNDEVKQLTKDICNDASLVLKFSNAKEHMIFCGDAHSKSIAKYLKKTWKKELKTTYVQTGHHGNNSFPFFLYRYMKPEAAFLDAPQWLIDGEQYSAKELLSRFHEKKVTTYDYRTAPNEITLK